MPIAEVEARSHRALHERPDRRRKTKSWAPEVDVPATIPCWSSKKDWPAQVEAALMTPEGRELRTGPVGRGVALATVMAVARVDAGTAESSTGRGVRTSHQTVARVLGRSRDTVQHARQVIERLGFAVVVAEGRRLDKTERAQAREHHGNEQINIASERVLTTPRPQPSPPLPRRGPVRTLPRQICGHPARAARAAGEQTTTPTTPVARRRRRPAPTRCPESYALPVQKLAADLVLRVPWWGRGHLGGLCQVLAVTGVDPARWDAPGLLWALDDRNRALGWDAPIPETHHRRLRLLARQLADIVPAYATRPTPTEQHHLDAKAARERVTKQQTQDTGPVEKVSPAEDDTLRERLDRIQAEAAEQARVEQTRKDAQRAQAEADKAVRAARAKAEREAAGVGPVTRAVRGGESQAAKIVRQKSRWKRLGVAG